MPRDVKDEVLEALNQEVKLVSNHNNLITDLGNKAMQTRHWNKVFALLENAQPTNLKSFSFSYLLSENVADHKEKIEEISA